MILNGSDELDVEQELNLGTLELDMKIDLVLYVFIEKECLFHNDFMIGGNGGCLEDPFHQGSHGFASLSLSLFLLQPT